MIRMRSNEDAVEMIKKAKELLDSACDMLHEGMNERRMRDSRGRFMGRDWERDMRDREDYDGMFDRGRYGY